MAMDEMETLQELKTQEYKAWLEAQCFSEKELIARILSLDPMGKADDGYNDGVSSDDYLKQ